MKPKVYIDGKEGTTGLQIYDRLASRSDIELLLIDEDKRKDPAERKKLMDAADIVFLCLPDAAAIEAVSLVENPDTVVIDTSTAHRTKDGWEYGFPELADRRERIAAALHSVGRDELDKMLREQVADGCPEQLSVDCHFCNEQYVFTREDVEALFRA